LDYELVYQVPGGVQQGVPGSVTLGDRSEFEAELLLGSESSGKFRYDEGVEEGTLTLRFRNEDGQLLTRFITEFHLQTGTDLLTSSEGQFNYVLDSNSVDYFITMNTVGIPGEYTGNISGGPFGVFTSSAKKLPGKIDSGFNEIFYWNGENWEKLESNESGDLGIFIGRSSE
jgi:hypothetical protein